MQRLADNLFAGPAFAENQHRQIGFCQPFDRRTQRLNRRAFPDDPGTGGSLLGQLVATTHKLFAFGCIANCDGRGQCQLFQARLIVLGEVARLLIDDLKRANH